MPIIGYQNPNPEEQVRQERAQYEAAGERHQWEDALAREAKEAGYNGAGRPSLFARIGARLRRKG